MLEKSGFGARLKAFAKENYGSVGALAALIEVHETQFSKYIIERNSPGWPVLERLHLVADMSIDWLISGEGSPIRLSVSGSESAKQAERMERALLDIQDITKSALKKRRAKGGDNGETP